MAVSTTTGNAAVAALGPQGLEHLQAAHVGIRRSDTSRSGASAAIRVSAISPLAASVTTMPSWLRAWRASAGCRGSSSATRNPAAPQAATGVAAPADPSRPWYWNAEWCDGQLEALVGAAHLDRATICLVVGAGALLDRLDERVVVGSVVVGEGQALHAGGGRQPTAYS